MLGANSPYSECVAPDFYETKAPYRKQKIGGKQRIKMTREEIISMLSTELNEKWDNGITCLIVENSDGCIPVIVHHKKDRLIVEVGEKDKKIYPIEWNELNKTSEITPLPMKISQD